MGSVHCTVEMEKQMTKGDTKKAFMVMRYSEKCRNSFFTVSFKKGIRSCQMKPEDDSDKQKSSNDGEVIWKTVKGD